MTIATTAERIVALLETANYRPAAQPFVVASVPFDFTAVMVGVGRAPDLIVVIDTIDEPQLRIRQKVESLVRALDVAGSRRPLTAILVGPKPSDPIIEALSRVCRVLPVGTPVGASADTQLQNWLAVLLPLPLPEPGEALGDPIGELLARLPSSLDQDLRTGLLDAAGRGPKAVQKTLKDGLAAALAPVEGSTGDAA